jgi:N-acetylglutamate synthase-like GNAT family acetyltransferase
MITCALGHKKKDVMLEKQLGEYLISTDKSKLDLDVIHAYLVDCYWAKGIPKEVLKNSIEHSLCFGVYKNKEQAGFCRAITDYCTFMYLADVFILESHRGQKLGVALIDAVVNHPDLQGIRTWTLLTKDAHGLYQKFGFENHVDPTRFMIRKVPYPYDENS